MSKAKRGPRLSLDLGGELLAEIDRLRATEFKVHGGKYGVAPRLVVIRILLREALEARKKKACES